VTTVTRKATRPLQDLFDWVDTPMMLLRPLLGQGMPMEDFVRDGRYVVRAELPGVDPEREVDVTVGGGILSIKAERREERFGKAHSEFRYGSFSRRIPLPPGADEDRIDASYDKGILEIVVGLKDKEGRQSDKKVAVKLAKSGKAG
jgi:HSP20 family protein